MGVDILFLASLLHISESNKLLNGQNRTTYTAVC
jgi:hypothetical protein